MGQRAELRAPRRRAFLRAGFLAGGERVGFLAGRSLAGRQSRNEMRARPEEFGLLPRVWSARIRARVHAPMTIAVAPPPETRVASGEWRAAGGQQAASSERVESHERLIDNDLSTAQESPRPVELEGRQLWAKWANERTASRWCLALGAQLASSCTVRPLWAAWGSAPRWN